MTDEIGGGTVQDPTWDVMNETELYVRTNENNVTMFVNVSSGMPISFNITNNGTIEQQLSRELGSSKHIIRNTNKKQCFIKSSFLYEQYS